MLWVWPCRPKKGKGEEMKFKATKKQMREGYEYIIGLNNMEHLLRYTSPIAYSVRAEGWACDYYDIDGVLISAGYSPLKSKNTKTDREDAEKTEAIARSISEDYEISYDDKKTLMTDLLKAYTRRALERNHA